MAPGSAVNSMVSTSPASVVSSVLSTPAQLQRRPASEQRKASSVAKSGTFSIFILSLKCLVSAGIWGLPSCSATPDHRVAQNEHGTTHAHTAKPGWGGAGVERGRAKPTHLYGDGEREEKESPWTAAQARTRGRTRPGPCCSEQATTQVATPWHPHTSAASNAHWLSRRPRNCRGNGGCCGTSGAQKVGKVGKQAVWTPRHTLSHPCQPRAAPLVAEGRRQCGVRQWRVATMMRGNFSMCTTP